MALGRWSNGENGRLAELTNMPYLDTPEFVYNITMSEHGLKV